MNSVLKVFQAVRRGWSMIDVLSNEPKAIKKYEDLKTVLLSDNAYGNS